jgi:hypothetical protein
LGVFQSRIARDVHAAWMPFAVIGGVPWAMRWILRTQVIRTNTTDRLAPRMPPDSGVAGRLSGRLLHLADQVRRLDPSGRHDPERFWRDRTELAGRIAALAIDAKSRF